MIGWPVRSLVWRIVLLQAVAVSAGVAFMSYELRRALDETAGRFERPQLEQRAELIARGLRRTGSGWSLTLPELDRVLYAHRYDGYGFVVMTSGTRVLFSSPTAGGAPPAPDGTAKGAPRLNFLRPSGDDPGVEIRRTVGGVPLSIRVIQDRSDPRVIVDDIEAAVLGRAALWRLLALMVLTLATWLIVKRAVGSLVQVSEAARRIGPEHIDLRLPPAGLPSEVLPLIEAVNSALDRLAEGYRRQSGFAADVAHELRTPLAVMRARTELMSPGAQRSQLQADIDGLSRTLQALLAEAEAEALVLESKEDVDLGAVCREVAALLAPLALRAGKEISVEDEEPVKVLGRAGLLMQAVRNLAENGLRHTPMGTGVELVVSAPGRIIVLDQGPGVDEADRQAIFQRRRRDRSTGGSAGLGLSIAARIVEAHGGAITVEGRPGGGAAFIIALPPGSIKGGGRR